MAYIVMAYIVMAYMVMAHIVMAYIARLLPGGFGTRGGRCQRPTQQHEHADTIADTVADTIADTIAGILVSYGILVMAY